ncbi:MAG: FkbM family methyltransferase [Saprospiraceae bacterium]|nr:FkbM family methyltransferase [Saprospiraceae bacterium]MCF8252216.1 FkbM family methyltransferase [Saprospiraceae bacterium]MCF8282014.1 FkbM family methyltransferase [Bacteroidales bacterium]MCF8311672.1 FkbM family methyltransferase [Saprospiraceae bacterium]MCF8442591.1 FkbM family methyltransferase [Saprospiraceae bacterium]
MLSTLEKKLEKIERLARGSVLDRLLNNPLRYLKAIGYWRLVYPLTKRGRFAKTSTFFGTEMEVVLPSATEIFLFGAKTHDSEIRLARFLMKNLKPGDVFCDVGAHFGYFSLLASQLVGEKGRVLAFEASRSTFGILQKNTAPFANIEPLHRAASDVDKTLVFNEFPALYSEYNSLVLPEIKNATWLKNNPSQPIEVAGIRLDDYFTEGKINPDMIKIDVEGSEPQVLKGMQQFLATNSPLVVMEYLLSNSQNEAHREAVAFVQAIGYQVFRIDTDGGLLPCGNVEAAMSKLGLDSDNIVLRK